ncbi:putative Aristolochene synthase [Hirsutella rhossiliensis]|uniref:Aristolochene synthase n=1 Tax=Hirsutella rhossiliensis TaxID=111463 RepID=A0A9P8SFN7_9HYPO|nr:putative Aristolochene synthase [Hirsutella rhossiliensis]KAH0959630.1 putative Aristolochene synthase [Hirsutella rhossiliensis]
MRSISTHWPRGFPGPAESSHVAKKELDLNVEEGWAKFPIYLFPEGDEQRTKLLAAVNVFIFIFDDFWEMHDITTEVFIERMQPSGSHTYGPESALQSLIDDTIAQILELDQENGNDSGRTMIEMMIRFFSRPPPPEKYDCMEDFLLYRHEDAAVPYVLGCTKFSLNSSVDLESPRLAKYIRLLKDHVSVANDLGSWEKEKKAYDTGKVLYLINAVDVVKRLFSLDTFDAAVAVTQGLQFQIECEIEAELQQLIDMDILTTDEWQFINATLHASIDEFWY